MIQSAGIGGRFFSPYFARSCEINQESVMWISIVLAVSAIIAILWRQWRALLRQLPDRAEHLVLF
ncbi:hypothetical protein HMPREF0004_0581 [Achromobacter piechaudii ATCC 43553]|uniref:Uncharacterized protein n=2 Tax=Achromobacter piechaudii TaxID=72556 RepID=D4X534_9BURK|nr:hypothetical protein HMPREF0004_0581 [Achromobacter piechaudii ATCC 43553]